MKYIETLLKKILPYAFCILGCCYLSAQDADDGEIPSIETILLSNLAIIPEFDARANRTTPSSDAVYIHQIGNDNVATVKTSGGNSELKLMQHGNANRADINVSGKNLVHNTVQNGNGNLFLEYGNAPHLDLERQILQNGNNQNVVIYGSNSLTQNLKLNVRGNAETITIRNFN